ncbi:hypothetical protein [Altibacter sp. HG106]|uniref:hypothetical protein n=1 Tax=Altibacter sp. HG106 TaxID=3023937 RepID=UPI00234FBF83|nr:hypothetical protein [Altibacter sp. HG106]MDC7994446.1 hypothetical protein [Altibacter sp. HG106]
MAENPFPLNIAVKNDTWEKLQLLLNVPEELKITAEEFNKVIAALNFIYNSGANEQNFLGTFDTYALFIAAHPVGEPDQFAFVLEEVEGVTTISEYRWNKVTEAWQKEESTEPQGATQMKVQGFPFVGVASLFFRFDSNHFRINQIQGGGIGIEIANPGSGGSGGQVLNFNFRAFFNSAGNANIWFGKGVSSSGFDTLEYSQNYGSDLTALLSNNDISGEFIAPFPCKLKHVNFINHYSYGSTTSIAVMKNKKSESPFYSDDATNGTVLMEESFVGSNQRVRSLNIGEADIDQDVIETGESVYIFFKAAASFNLDRTITMGMTFEKVSE